MHETALPDSPGQSVNSRVMTDRRSAAFARLRQLADRPGGRRIAPLFAADRHRAARFGGALDDLTLDFSKLPSDDAALDGLFALAVMAAPLQGRYGRSKVFFFADEDGFTQIPVDIFCASRGQFERTIESTSICVNPSSSAFEILSFDRAGVKHWLAA